MPIEIKELHIRVNVNSPKEGSTLPQTSDKESEDKVAIISESVETVMEIIKNKKER